MKTDRTRLNTYIITIFKKAVQIQYIHVVAKVIQRYNDFSGMI